jgi:hypothetical protein
MPARLASNSRGSSCDGEQVPIVSSDVPGRASKQSYEAN